MPGHTSKPGADFASPEAGIPPDDFLGDSDEEELAEDHVVRRFFATHERDLRPDLRHPPRPGVKRHGDEGTRSHPRPNLRRRRQGAPDDEG